MPSTRNRVIIACAGSGKTTRLVEEALAHHERRIAIITYTHNNMREIMKRFTNLNSGQPSHVEVLTWYSFLLQHCVRPYQRTRYSSSRIEELTFVSQRSTRWERETNVPRFYMASPGSMYSDKASQFAVTCEERSGGALSARISSIYTDVFVDEFQDLAGWDLEVIKMLLGSGVRVTLVGDPRQHVYQTNPGAKHRQYQGASIVRLISMWQDQGLCAQETMDSTWRCRQEICEFTNKLWPDMPEMASRATGSTGHDGVFLVSPDLIQQYVATFKPQVLRHDTRTPNHGLAAMNFGQAKGLEFDRVLILPTKVITKYLKTGELRHVEGSKNKLHVAATRARFSVAFLFDGESPVVSSRWTA